MLRQDWMTDEVIRKAKELGEVGRYELARATGLSEWKARTLLEFVNGYQRLEEKEVSREASDNTGRVLALLRNPVSVEEVADALCVPPAVAREAINRIRESGFPVDEVSRDTYWINRSPAKAETETPLPRPVGTNQIKVGIVSDTHLGSKEQQLTHLRSAYAEFAEMGITTVYHAGDLFAGVGVYKGQHNDLFLHSYGQQVEYAEVYYPQLHGVTTYVISGNHDLKSLMNGGSDPVVELSKRRPDIVSLGATSAWARSDGGEVSIYLLHPTGSSGYSPSYKLQRLIESFEGGHKPTIAVCGHWHQACRIRQRNVIGYMPGCFEAQTDYETRKMLQPQIGALALSIRIDDSGRARKVSESWLENFVPIEKDWQ